MRLLFAIMLALASSAFAADVKGFDGIPFGLNKTQVLEEIFKSGYTPEDQSGQLLVPIYKLGDLPVEVIFRFNRQGKFFSYDMRTGAIELERFPKVIEAIRYMSEQLSQRFGEPIKKNFYRLEEIQGKKAASYWIWENPELDVVTFIKPRDARFYAQGSVTDKVLAREK